MVFSRLLLITLTPHTRTSLILLIQPHPLITHPSRFPQKTPRRTFSFQHCSSSKLFDKAPFYKSSSKGSHCYCSTVNFQNGLLHTGCTHNPQPATSKLLKYVWFNNIMFLLKILNFLLFFPSIIDNFFAKSWWIASWKLD